MLIKNSFPPKLEVILLGGAEAPPAPMVETPMGPTIFPPELGSILTIFPVQTARGFR